MAFSIRRLTRDDAPAFREIRLEALEQHPEAFLSSYEDEAAWDIERFVSYLENGAVFGGLIGERLAGNAGFFALQKLKQRHKGVLWGMYVRADARGSGLAEALLTTVLEHAQREVEIVQLSVEAGNVAARRLYERCGFQAYGMEPASVKLDGRYYDDQIMCKRFAD